MVGKSESIIQRVDKQQGPTYRTGNYIHYAVIKSQQQRILKRIYVYMYVCVYVRVCVYVQVNHFAAQWKLTHCKTTALHLKTRQTNTIL